METTVLEQLKKKKKKSKGIQETVAEVIMKYDNGLNFDDSSCSGENESGSVLEVKMTGPCNENGE